MMSNQFAPDLTLPFTDARARADRSLDDERVTITTAFEGGNGEAIRSAGPGRYALTLEPEPGSHLFSGKGYYVCVAVRNKLAQAQTISLRLEAQGWDGKWGRETGHLAARRGSGWTQLAPEAFQRTPGMPDAVDVELMLGPAGTEDAAVVLSNFHWWPYSDVMRYLHRLPGGRRVEIGRSVGGRPIVAVEFGDESKPCMVHAATSQPSEAGAMITRGLIDFLLSDDEDADRIRRRFRTCIVPVTNPDGAVMGYGVSDGEGRFPFFEADQAAAGSPTAPPAMRAVWRYLETCRPWLFWEWHSNNWSRRPGHMLLRYQHDLVGDPARQALWDDIEDRLLALPDAHHGNWTSPDTGMYRESIGYQAALKLGAIACMIKLHDRFSAESMRAFAVRCLIEAAEAHEQPRATGVVG